MAEAAVRFAEETLRALDDRTHTLESEEAALRELPALGTLRAALRELQIRVEDTAKAEEMLARVQNWFSEER